MLRALATLTAVIGRFFRWWFGELGGLLPASWILALKRERQRLVVTFYEHSDASPAVSPASQSFGENTKRLAVKIPVGGR